VCQITGTTEEYSSYSGAFTSFRRASADRACRMAARSAFLDMFGRPPATRASNPNATTPHAEQRLHLLNSSHIQLKIQQSSKLRTLCSLAPEQAARPIDRLYLATLSRTPPPKN